MKTLINRILEDKENRRKLISEFQNLMWNTTEGSDILHTLAYDLDFYQPNEEIRKELPTTLYGDEKLEEVILEALRDLENEEASQ